MIARRHSILFVNDDPLILRGLQRSMDEYCDNWEAEFASSGEEALTKLSEHPYDAIVTDMRMPVMDGIQLLDTVNRMSPGVFGLFSLEIRMMHKFLNLPTWSTR